MIACGLDFGTSNSAIGIARGDAVALAPLEDDKTLMPSAVFFDYEAHRARFGSDAIAAYVGQTEGRLMRALKTILGSPLIDEKTSLGGRMVPLVAGWPESVCAAESGPGNRVPPGRRPASRCRRSPPPGR